MGFENRTVDGDALAGPLAGAVERASALTYDTDFENERWIDLSLESPTYAGLDVG
jgi:hypothetical protein